MASLGARCFMTACVAMELSYFCLFVDLSKAFDFVVREVIMGWPPSMIHWQMPDKVEFLCSLGLEQDAAAVLAAWVDSTGGLLMAAGASECWVRTIASLHDGAWFKLPGDTRYICSLAGGRQGCKLGACVFNLIYAMAFAMLRTRLEKLGVVLKLCKKDNEPFWASAGAASSWDPTAGTSIFEITYVDDELIFLAASSVQVMMRCVPVVIECMTSCFAFFGFQINWKPGNKRRPSSACAASVPPRRGQPSTLLAMPCLSLGCQAAPCSG